MADRFRRQCSSEAASESNSNIRFPVSYTWATKEAEITLNFKDVPEQSGASDCGVYAIAFATALAQGKHPECYVFTQHKMRVQLRRCLIGGKMEKFPHTEVCMSDAGSQGSSASPHLLFMQNA